MKKIMIVVLSVCLSMLCLSNSFASIRVSGYSPNSTSNPQLPFEGNISFVNYYNQMGEQVIVVDLQDEKKNFLQLTFKDIDLPVGIALLNATGKPLVVEFADANFTVNGVFTYDNVHHKKFDKPQS